MRIVANRRSVKADKNGYLYFTKHGVGPGALPKDVKLIDWRDVDDNITAIWLDRFLTTRELKEYDIYPETSDQHKMYSKKLNSCTITASRPDNSYQHYYAYDYKGKYRFSIHYDDVTDIEDPELSFKQFRASVSPIKPYDDGDYAWARIQNGSIDCFRKGKLIKKEYYFMFSDYGTDYEDMYENANEWITDITDRACDTLIELNQNVEPRIIHNSKSIQSSDENKLSSEFIDSYRIAKAQFEKAYTDSYVALNRHKDDSDRVDIIVHVKDDYGIAHEGYINVNINETNSDLLYERFCDAADILLKEDSVEGCSIFSDEDENWFLKSVPQEYTSENTSINKAKLPAVYNLIKLKPGSLVVDFGGGKWDTAVEHFAKEDITILVYDPYNRSAEHNREVLRILRENGGADAAVNSNVLNVIKEPEARKNVLENIARITKPGAPIYITVYEGRGDNQEGPTKSGYQLNRKTADYLEEIQEVFPDATRKGKLIIAHNSSSVTSFTNVESYEDDQYIDRFDKDIDSYILIARKDVEDTDGFSTEYAIYQIILKDGSIEYECYFGDSDIYGPWNGDGLDFESDSNDEAVAWYNSYESEDVTTSTITSARNDSKILTTEEIDAMLNNLKADLHSAIITTMTSKFGFDKKEADEYSRINIELDPDYDGVRIEVGAELSYRGLDKLREILDKTLNLYVKDAYFDMAEPGILETYFAASDITPDNISSSKIVARRYDVPERPLDPPDYDEGYEVETEATIEVPFNQVITIDRDGRWSYSDEEYNFTKTDDGKSDHYDDEYHVYLDDNVGIVEKLDSFLLEKLPATPGAYRIQGDLTLVYDIENIRQYSNNDGYWSDEDGFNPPSYETYTDDAEAYYNKSKSSLDNFKYTKIK